MPAPVFTTEQIRAILESLRPATAKERSGSESASDPLAIRMRSNADRCIIELAPFPRRAAIIWVAIFVAAALTGITTYFTLGFRPLLHGPLMALSFAIGGGIIMHSTVGGIARSEGLYLDADLRQRTVAMPRRRQNFGFDAILAVALVRARIPLPLSGLMVREEQVQLVTIDNGVTASTLVCRVHPGTGASLVAHLAQRLGTTGYEVDRGDDGPGANIRKFAPPAAPESIVKAGNW